MLTLTRLARMAHYLPSSKRPSNAAVSNGPDCNETVLHSSRHSRFVRFPPWSFKFPVGIVDTDVERPNIVPQSSDKMSQYYKRLLLQFIQDMRQSLLQLMFPYQSKDCSVFKRWRLKSPVWC
jgi:hypothetical protein